MDSRALGGMSVRSEEDCDYGLRELGLPSSWQVARRRCRCGTGTGSAHSPGNAISGWPIAVPTSREYWALW